MRRTQKSSPRIRKDRFFWLQEEVERILYTHKNLNPKKSHCFVTGGSADDFSYPKIIPQNPKNQTPFVTRGDADYLSHTKIPAGKSGFLLRQDAHVISRAA